MNSADDTASDALEINWPGHYAPQNSPIHVRNSLWIAAPAEIIWAWLIRAELWPDWYGNASQVRIGSGGRGGPDLALDTAFSWRTFGVSIKSRVQEFEPCQRIAWDGHAIGIDVYHGWAIEARDQGCMVVTEETQHGLIARAGALVMPTRMADLHQVWLEGLAQRAASGKP